ncbi:MAG: hypothetical protein ABH831_00440 [Candidatus Nealsonbacteria bacterium]
MAKLREREKAIALRKEKQMSYSQIKKILKVSKSTLSLWLNNYPLSKQRIRELRDRNEQRIERYRETRRRKKEERLKQFYKKEKKLVFPLSKRESFLAGLFLYLGEGTKSHPAELSISNTDPSIAKFFLVWLTKTLMVPKEKIKIQLHLYRDMDIKNKVNFWSKTLNIPLIQFTKPYIKKTSSIRINHKGSFGHGTCNVSIGNARLSEKIIMAIKAITDKYGKMRT